LGIFSYSKKKPRIGLRKKLRGAALVEYALITALIAIAVITVMSNLGSKISEKVDYIKAALNSAKPYTVPAAQAADPIPPKAKKEK
jgi:Flp pilus assembly pilin Flp